MIGDIRSVLLDVDISSNKGERADKLVSRGWIDSVIRHTVNIPNFQTWVFTYHLTRVSFPGTGIWAGSQRLAWIMVELLACVFGTPGAFQEGLLRTVSKRRSGGYILDGFRMLTLKLMELLGNRHVSLARNLLSNLLPGYQLPVAIDITLLGCSFPWFNLLAYDFPIFFGSILLKAPFLEFFLILCFPMQA